MTEPSPLSEASPQSLDELFSRNPRDLTDSDMDRIIAEMRRQRANWLIAEQQGKTCAPKAAKAKPTGEIDMSVLD